MNELFLQNGDAITSFNIHYMTHLPHILGVFETLPAKNWRMPTGNKKWNQNV